MRITTAWIGLRDKRAFRGRFLRINRLPQRTALLLGTGLFLLGGGTELRAQETEEEAPKLVVAQTIIRMDVQKNEFWDSRSTSGRARGSMLVSNQGTAAATGIEVAAFYSDGTPVAVKSEPAAGSTTATDLAPNATLALRLEFDWRRPTSDTGWFVVTTSSANGSTLTVPFQLRELMPGAVLGITLAASAIVAAVLVAIVALMRGKNRELTIGPTWTFKDSWASNLTAFGAILGTVLAASGFLADVLPGLSTGMFGGFSLLYGLLALAAPLVFTMFYKGGKPSYPGLLAAAWVTLWAVTGGLATIVQLVNRGGLDPLIGWVAFGILLVVVFFYAHGSIAAATAEPTAPRVDQGTAATMAAATAAAITLHSTQSPDRAKEAAQQAAAAAIDSAKPRKGRAAAPPAPAVQAMAATTIPFEHRPAAIL